MFIIGAGVRRCPRCKVFIEKNGGCPQMDCARCHYNFCWCCMSEGGYGHATWYRPCPGLPYGILTNLLITVCFMVVWPFMLVLIPPLAAFPVAAAWSTSCIRPRGGPYSCCEGTGACLLFVLFLPFSLLGAGLIVCALLAFALIPMWLACLLFIVRLIFNTMRNLLS